MTRTGRRLVGGIHRRRLIALALGTLVAPGCVVFRREPLDVPPGYRLVLGRVDLGRFDQAARALLEIAREDGTYRYDLPVDAIWSPFVITLPPGRYQITRLRRVDMGRTFPNETSFTLAVAFEVGDAAAVYVGTLQIERAAFGRQLSVAVEDEYERTVPAIRARYPDLPPVIARALMRPI